MSHFSKGNDSIIGFNIWLTLLIKNPDTISCFLCYALFHDYEEIIDI